MRLKNHTDIPNDRVREMIAFARPPGIAGFSVRVSNCAREFGGTAYGHRNHVVVRIGREKHHRALPHRHRNGYLPMPARTREETLLWLLAHELRHLWQHRVPRGYRVWGARGRMSERDADAYALRVLRHWRRGEKVPHRGAGR